MINPTYFRICLVGAITHIPENLWIAGLTLLISVIIGAAIAMLRAYHVPVLKQIFDVIMAISKALPTNLVLLIVFILSTRYFVDVVNFLHLPLTIKDLNISAVAIAAMVICTTPGVSEVIRSGLHSVDHGQYEAGYSVGLTRSQTFFQIILPQATRSIIPPLTNSILTLVKGTALVSVIGVVDIMNGAVIAASFAYCYLEAYVAAAIVFWVIGALLEQLSKQVEKYFSKSIKTLSNAS